MPGARRAARRPARRPLIRALPAAVGRLSEHPLVGRLIASKAWIGVVAFALIGIVALQLLLLQLNRSIGRDLARETVLQQQNAALSVENSELAVGEHIQRQAGGLGMTLIPSGALRFLGVHHGEAGKAAAALSTPVLQTNPEGETKAAASAEHGESSSEAGAGAEASSHEGSSEEGANGEAARASSPEASATTEARSSEGASEHTEAGAEAHSEAGAGASGGEATSGGGTSAAPAG